ncbi:MAG: saccharopine dehydrogenase NADP-binding domain-containing protein [Imperialibacter sp.]|uniref:saccharopine dehydrogenase family protein n=1 Tax=Imperialibacter sp. TaxID=2038411 RepID=UPI0032EB35C1
MTKRILLVGAGRSSFSLINYLISLLKENNWQLCIGDLDVGFLSEKFGSAENVQVISFDIFNQEQKTKEITQSDLVISMLPAKFHIHVAEVCAEHGINMITASYVTDDIKALDEKFKAKGAICVMEMGLDPGLDHMSAMKVLDRIKDKGYKLHAFETFTGGLLAPSTEDNPWQYKFTWNPRNVVLAGQGIVKFIQEGRFKYIPYHKVFRRTEVIHIPGHGYFEGYANRDSLKYVDSYELHDIQTLYRGTLRRPGFCKAWDIFIQLGATDDSFKMEKVDEMTHRQFINSFLYFNPHDSVELKLAHYLNIDMESEEMYKLKWLGLFDDESVGLKEGTPAQVLEHILKKKWTPRKDEKDMIVMWHKFDFKEGEQAREIQSYMVVMGDNANDTAMAKTVGLPLGIGAKMILNGEFKLSGVQIPTKREIYKPVLKELEAMGFEFSEREIDLMETAKG